MQESPVASNLSPLMNQPTQTWLTQEAADRLKAELAELEGPLRAEIIKKIETARAEGDLKENGGYHAAREEQGKIDVNCDFCNTHYQFDKVDAAQLMASDLAAQGSQKVH